MIEMYSDDELSDAIKISAFGSRSLSCYLRGIKVTNYTNNIEDFTLSELAGSIAGGEMSVMEITDYYLKRIKKFNPKLNAVLTTTEEYAREKAVEIDNLIRQGKLEGPLAGIPFLLKDLFCTTNIKTTCGSQFMRDYVPTYNATVFDRLEKSGAILLGKTNMDEFAMGSSNENSSFGPVCNPWNPERVPGGSSGGSAAAVGARIIPYALGSDTGGSIRQPASFTGITGLKPTYGRITRYGMVAFASSLDCCGVLAVSAEDIAYVLEAIAGKDAKDSTSIDAPVPNYSKNLNNDISGLKIGMPEEFFSEHLDSNVSSIITQAIDDFGKRGAIVKRVKMPNLSNALSAYYILAPAECSSNLSRFDGVRYGARVPDTSSLVDFLEQNRYSGLGKEVKRRIMIGTYALSAGYYDAYYKHAQKIRRLVSNDFRNALNEVDVLMGPVAPTIAFPIGEKVDSPVQMYLADIFTIPISLAGLPAVSIPVGFSEGLPVGLQVIGNHLQEDKLLNIAHIYQKNTDYHLKKPPIS